VARLAALAALLLMAACAARNQVVLLADEEGPPSVVSVSNSGGTAVLSQPGTAVGIRRETSLPKPVTLDEAEIQERWADALAYHPQRPVTMLLYFTLDTTELTAESRAELPRVLGLIRQRTAPEVVIVGHADRSGDEAYNYQLGLRRAAAVRRRIEALGVPPELISIASHDSVDPLVQTLRPYEPRNRRVEVTVR
jgi:outer membrane protein OmpA-like peptidoglycan-associated protein